MELSGLNRWSCASAEDGRQVLPGLRNEAICEFSVVKERRKEDCGAGMRQSDILSKLIVTGESKRKAGNS
jgi:hypothetical protein